MSQDMLTTYEKAHIVARALEMMLDCFGGKTERYEMTAEEILDYGRAALATWKEVER